MIPDQNSGLITPVNTKPLVLVTGGAGFIGSTLVDSLLRMNYRVRVLDNLDTGYIQYLDFLHPDLEFVHGDILDKEEVHKSLMNVTGVFHLAAVSKSSRHPGEAALNFDTNVIGTVHLLEAAVASTTVRRFIYIGSATYYETQDTDMTDDPFSPSSSLGTSKFMGEMVTANFDKLFNLSTVSVRFFSVFGPRQPVTGLFDPTRFSNRHGTSTTFLHVHEVANGLLTAYHSNIRGTAILLSPRENLPQDQLARMINMHNPVKASYSNFTSSFDSLEETARIIHRSFSDGDLQHKAPFWDIFSDELAEKFPGWFDMTPEAQSAVIGAYLAEGNLFPDF